MGLASIWNIARRDVDIPKSSPTELLLEKHQNFMVKFEQDRTSFEYVMTEYLRMSGVYWLIGGMDIIGEVGRANADLILDFVKKNQNEDMGFAAADDHDSN